MDFIETLKMNENDFFYNLGGIVGLCIGWSIISFSSFPMISIRIANKFYAFITKQMKYLKVRLMAISMVYILKLTLFKLKLIINFINEYSYKITLKILMNLNNFGQHDLKFSLKNLMMTHIYLLNLIMILLKVTWKSIRFVFIKTFITIEMCVVLFIYIFDQLDEFLF